MFRERYCSNLPFGRALSEYTPEESSEKVEKKCLSLQVIEKPQSECLRAPNFGTAYVPYEAAVSVDLSHPNIVTTYKFVVEQITVGPDNPNIIEGWSPDWLAMTRSPQWNTPCLSNANSTSSLLFFFLPLHFFHSMGAGVPAAKRSFWVKDWAMGNFEVTERLLDICDIPNLQHDKAVKSSC